MRDGPELLDPTAAYCAARVKTVKRMAKASTELWYKLFRRLGCNAIDSYEMAREATQSSFNKCDFTVNFDGPMI